MKILSSIFPGSIKLCSSCGCLFSYLPSDIYENKWIYCPICHEKIESPQIEGNFTIVEDK